MYVKLLALAVTELLSPAKTQCHQYNIRSGARISLITRRRISSQEMFRFL